MDRNMKKLLCVISVLLLLTGCRSGGGETTQPTVPTVTQPKGESVEEWDDPIQTTAPQPNTTQPPESTTEPQESTTQPTEQTEPMDQTDPTEPPVQSTEPADPTDPPAPPATTEPQTGGSGPAGLSYEEYLSMSPAEQQAHYESFPSLEAYIAWHNAALAEYEENQSSIEVTGGIDIGDFSAP